MPKNIYERDGVYYARFSIDNKLRRVCLRTRDLREARTRLKALKVKYENARFGLSDAASWIDAVTGYIAGVLDAGGVKPTTAKRYRVSLAQIDDHFRGLKLAEIDHGRLSKFISARQRDGAKNATIRRDLTTISRVLAHAVANNQTTTNPALAYDRSLIREKRAAIQAPPDEVIETAISYLPGDWAALIRFLRATGLRLGEALRARQSDVHDGALTIRETKSGKVRTVRVPAPVLPSVPPGRRLFGSIPDDVATVSSKWAHFRRQVKDMPRFRLHDLRHAYAISQIRAGRDIYDLSHHLGHSSVKVTEIYLGYATNERAQPRYPTTSLTQGDTGHDTRQFENSTETV